MIQALVLLLGCPLMQQEKAAETAEPEPLRVPPLVLEMKYDVKTKACVPTNKTGTKKDVFGRVRNTYETVARVECCPDGFLAAGVVGDVLQCLESPARGRMAIDLQYDKSMRSCLGEGYSPQICCPDGWQFIGYRENDEPNLFETTPKKVITCLSDPLDVVDEPPADEDSHGAR